MRPSTIVLKFDIFLKNKNLSFTGIAIGGAALEILGVISRETQDCDILDPEIPKDILDAAKDFSHNNNIFHLKESWFNNGPATLVPHLPQGWKSRIVILYQGQALTLYTLGRLDLLATKLFAFCDRGQDLGDCLAMNPSRQELLELRPWIKLQDENQAWPDHVEDSLCQLSRKLGYGL